MDELECRAYGECSRAFAKDIDDSSEKNINALAALAVMELRFMHGCTVDWSRRDGEGGTAAGAASSSSQVLTSGSQHDDGEGSNDEGDGSNHESRDAEEFDFTKIDCNQILTTVDWSVLDYADATEFVTCRECLALATVFFLCEELGDKFPELRDQVHAGWMHAIKEPISLDLLLEPPDEIQVKYNDEEEEWQCEAMQLFVAEMTEVKREELGITHEHLEMLNIDPPRAVSPNPCHDALPSAVTIYAADGSSLPQPSHPKGPKGRTTGRAPAASRTAAAASPAATASGIGDRQPPRKRGTAAAPARGDASASPAVSAARHTKRKKVPPPPPSLSLPLPLPLPLHPSGSLSSHTPPSCPLQSGPPRARYRVRGRRGAEPGQQVTVRCLPQAQRHRK